MEKDENNNNSNSNNNNHDLLINEDLDTLSLNDEEIRSHLTRNSLNYYEHHITHDDTRSEHHGSNEDLSNIREEGEGEQQILTDLIVTSLPNDLFTNEFLKEEFENMFKKYAENVNYYDDENEHQKKKQYDEPSTVKFFYFRILKRCTVKFSRESAALHARYELDNQLFLGEPIRLFFSQPIKLKNSRKFLEPPENNRTFLISPPASPPIGWESTHEDPPVVNLHLVAALSRLDPHEPFELIKSDEKIPGIILHPCVDEVITTNDNKPKKFIPTRRPASDMS